MKQLGVATTHVWRTADRLLAALLMAAAVTLLVCGLLWYGSPGGTGSDLAHAPLQPAASTQPQDNPGNLPSTSLPVVVTTQPPSALPSGSPQTSSPPGASEPAGSPAPTANAGDPAVATRVVVPSLEIDLPVVSRDLVVPNQGPDQYPPCDVALYHTAFGQPGQAGTTYIYAHARDGMFLPLLTAAQKNKGASLIGSLVEVYTDDDLRYVYAITVVEPLSIDYSITQIEPPGTSQLILQTSTGPRGTVPKLQILALLQDVLPASQADSHPKTTPRACYDTP